MRTLRLPLATCVLACGLTVAPSPAAGQVSERIEVRVVNVDAFVHDRRGDPVHGLERADFEILVDGEAVPIVNFYAVEQRPDARPQRGDPGREAEQAVTGAPPLQLAILVDSSNVEARARNQGLDQLRDFLRANLGSGARVMLVTSPRKGAGLVASPDAFTDRLDVLERGLDEIAATPAQDRRLAEFRQILQDVGVSLAASGASAQGRMRSLEARIRAFSAEASRDTGRAAADLWRLVSALAGLPGNKAILYLGGGLSLRPGEALTGALNQALGRYAGLLPEGAPVPDLPGSSFEDDGAELRALAQYASVRGVAFYMVALGDSAPSAAATLSRGSVEAGAGPAPGQEESWAPAVGLSRQFDLMSSLQLLAGATGGLATAGRHTGRLLGRLLADAQAHYSLGIEPPEGDPGEVHRLEVRVRGRGRGLRVRHREIVRAVSHDEEDAARTLSALWADAGHNGLEARLEAGDPRPAGNGLYAVPISVQVPLAALAITSRGDVHTGQVSIFFAAESDGIAGPVRKAVFPVTLDNAEILGAMGRMADYRLEVEMRPGPGRIAVGVRDDFDPRLSTQFLDLVVGDSPELPARIAAPELRQGGDPLRAVDRHSGADTSVSPSLPVALETGAPRTAAVETRETGPTDEGPSRRRTKARKVRLPEDETAGAYRHALRLLAGGETPAASQALSELETGAARQAVYDQLDKIESRVLAELAAASPDSLLPVALLHADLVAVYRRRGLGPLAEHGLRMSIRAAKTAARQGSGTGARSAARALTELAGDLLRAGRLVEAIELFELALDGDDVDAGLGLGFSHERLGHYEQAAAALAPLAASDQRHAEARLRLALNLERLGKTSRSRPLLDALLRPPPDGETPDWIAVLAAQETARIAIREGRLERAAGVLNAALERWPDHHGLGMQQAFLTDLGGAPRRAAEQVARLIAAGDAGPGASDASSPRARYNRWPVDDAARRALREDAGRRLAELDRALRPAPP